jgi:hypothetical protein
LKSSAIKEIPMRKAIILFCRRASLLCLAAAVMNLHAAAAPGAFVAARVPPAAELSVSGRVMVDGSPGLSGQTCFSGSTFVVAARSRSALALLNRARIELSEETTLKLDFSGESVAGALEVGRLRVFVPAGVEARFTAAAAAFRSDPGQPALFSIQFGESGAPTVHVELGQVEMNVGGRTEAAGAGQFLSADSGARPLPAPGLSLSRGKKIGLAVGFGLLGTMLAMILTDDHHLGVVHGGCVITLSPVDGPPPPCDEGSFSLP